MKNSFPPVAALLLLAASMQAALAADGGTSGVVIAVGPRQPAAASVLLGGGAVAPTVHKRAADFGLIATALAHGDAEIAGTPAASVSSAAGQPAGTGR